MVNRDVNLLKTDSFFSLTLSYFRTKDDAKIDLIVERPGRKTALFEIKSKNRIHPQDAANINSFLPAFKNAEGYLLSCDPTTQKMGGVDCLLWKDGIELILNPD